MAGKVPYPGNGDTCDTDRSSCWSLLRLWAHQGFHLTTRAQERSAVSLTQPFDWCPAAPASFPLPLKDEQEILVVSRLSVQINKIGEARPSALDRGEENLSDRGGQPAGFLPRDGEATPGGMDARAKEGFTYVYVSESGDPSLIEQKRFYFLPALRKLSAQPVLIKSRSQGIFAQRFQLRNLVQPGDFISGKKTKPPRIAISQLGSVGETYSGMGVLFQLAVGDKIREPSGHSKMDEPEEPRLHFGNQVFAAAMDFADGPAPELSRK